VEGEEDCDPEGRGAGTSHFSHMTGRPPPPGSMPAVRAANSDGQGAALMTDSVSRRLTRGVKGSCKPRHLGNVASQTRKEVPS
jgi:hypothetical protein